MKLIYDGSHGRKYNTRRFFKYRHEKMPPCNIKSSISALYNIKGSSKFRPYTVIIHGNSLETQILRPFE